MSLKKQGLKIIRVAALIASIGLLSPLTYAAEDKASQPNKLRLVMQGLLNDSLVLNQGIFYKDYSKIEQAAKDIANHPKPGKGTMKKVMFELKTEMGAFKAFDTLVHNAAVKIEEAAAKKDMQQIKSNYHEMLNGCLSCHTQYKERVSNIL